MVLRDSEEIDLEQLELEGLASLERSFRDGLRPEPKLLVSEWADKYRQLSPLSSPEPGQWRTSRVPYLREVMDCLSPSSPTSTVVLQWGAQLGKTEAGNNWLAYIVDQAPGPLIYIMPTVDTAKRVSRTRIDPLFDVTPRLAGKLKDRTTRDSMNNRLEKHFRGGVMIFTGANSAAGLRSSSVRYEIADEIDEYPLDVDGQGDPLLIVAQRSKNFRNRKRLRISTPTFEGSSRIAQEAELGDQCYYHVACPHCGHFQPLVWKNLRWDPGDYKSVRYYCEHCAAAIEERHKLAMLAGGRWVATNPNPEEGRRSFYLSSLYSPLGWYSWKDAARDWEQSAKDPEKRRAFVNLVLGETWKEQVEAPKWERLFNRAEDYKIGVLPLRVLAITAGADVQKDRIEVTIIGHGREKERWAIDHIVIAGDPTKPEIWKELDDLVDKTWEHEGGGRLPLIRFAIDSSYASDDVQAWARKHPPNKVVCVRGREHLAVTVAQPTAIEVTSMGKKRRRGGKFWPIGLSIVKSSLYARLKNDAPIAHDGKAIPSFDHFPRFAEEYFKQLCSEKLVTRQLGGHRRRRITYWDKEYERNEVLDCWVYAIAAAVIAGIDRYEEKHWRDLEAALGLVRAKPSRQDAPEQETPPAEPPTAPPPPQPAPRRRESLHWKRWRPTP